MALVEPSRFRGFVSAGTDNLAGRDGAEASPGLGRALRRLRDPVLLAAVPVVFALLLAFVGYRSSWPIGFDFRGTLWEPAHALLGGTSMYPDPTREAVSAGNPAVYPPPFILVSVPLAVLPAAVASWLWFVILAAGVLVSMWVLGVRDWRCHVLAVTSPVVAHGLFFGNLTVLLVVPLALAWRYRDRAWIVGVAVGAAVAAKLFVWPLVVWLLLTRRFRAAAWAVGSAAALVFGAWALVGFQGLWDYPSLLRAVQDVYAVRSVSLSTVAASFGASVPVSVSVAAFVGLGCLSTAAWLARRDDGDRRAFAVVVAACVLASPIVWPNYAALLFVPIAVTWPRLAPAWFFGYAIWLVNVLAPKPTAAVCCTPAGVTEQAWARSHTDPTFGFAAGAMLVVVLVVVSVVMARVSRPPPVAP